jgi:hypothetical protein
MYSKKKSEDVAELRHRGLNAARLAMTVPSLASLRIEVHEHSATACITYKKHVAVGSAPALFVLACGDERCEDGGHDITHLIMRALNARQKSGEGVHVCEGATGTATCTRRIRFQFAAEYHTAN